MAHAYETFIEGGRRIGGTLGAGDDGPVGIDEVDVAPNGKVARAATTRTTQAACSTHGIADQTRRDHDRRSSRRAPARRAALGPGSSRPARRARPRTSGDAWFVGFTERWTVAVWVGYPDKLKPMLTEFAGRAGRGRHLSRRSSGTTSWSRPTRSPTTATPRTASARGLPPKPPTTTTTTTDPGAGHPDQPAPVPEGGAGAPAAPPPTPTAAPATGTGTGGAADDRHRRHRHDARHAAAPRPTTPPPAAAPAPAATGTGGGASAPPRAPAPRRGQRGARAQRRRPRPRHVAVAARAEAPRQLDRLGDPDARADVERAAPPSRARAARCGSGPSSSEVRVELEADAERLGELARAVAQLLVARDAPARAHDLDARRAARARG